MGILETGVSGLMATQRSLAVVSNNIANINTDGYTRQRTVQAQQTAQFYGYGYVGNGVTTQDIQRIYDQYAVAQVRATTSSLSQAQQYQSLATQVNNLLGAEGAGIMPALQNFFDAIQGVANDPSSRVARQLMIGQADTLAAQFGYVDQQLDQMEKNTNAMLASTVQEINNLSAGIADINRRITDAGIKASPNDLLDQRDELIRQLSEKVAVTTVEQSDGSVNVFIGNGQAVVAGSTSNKLTTVPNAYDPSRMEVAYAGVSGLSVISGQLTGGAIGGLLEFRTQVLDPARNSINQLAMGVAETFNSQHAMGMDMYGELGGDFFRSLTDAAPLSTTAIMPRTGNSGAPPAVISAAVTDVGVLTTSDYVLARNSAGYTLTRVSDNKVFNLNGFPAGAVTIDGVTLSLDGGTFAEGDTFLIRPAANAAFNFGVAVTDPDRIAAAGPLRTGADLNNLGKGTISEATLTDRSAYTGQSYRIMALDTDNDGVVDSYSVRDPNDNKVAAGAYVSGQAITFGGISVSLSGTPAAGDVFTASPNAGGVSDNRNALALGGLQTKLTMNGSSASYQTLYGALIGDIGGKTRQAEANVSVQSALLSRANDTRESVSGVNLDEEAASIIRLQQAYQAAAQVISVASTLFDSLLAAVRR
ncbi:MAG: flagellar hook-associated protein FlgK [Chromatiales bacterium]|jgi:flagellar hook-associated protein 1 FlgK|nr:flagellar hook-associated protein FlgK [Chromatiales bacterium]